ncbi:MAG: MFS transporter [Firmicutes bacterium]|nr:MFS transporter [Bacillota bacterium]
MSRDSELPPQGVETPAAPAPRVPLDVLLAPERGWFRALRHPDFRLFWVGNFVSNIGTWMHNVAQGWLVLLLTNSPWWLGVLGFAQQLPALLFSLPGGVLADRIPRRRLLFTTQSTMLALALTLAVLVWRDAVTVPIIIALAFLAGTTMALNAPSYQAALRDLVAPEDTLNAIALNSIQFNTSRVLGPSIAGFLIAAVGVAACFFLNALSYLALLFAILKVKFPEREARPVNSFRAELVEGFHYVWAHRAILMLVVVVAMVSMFGLPYLVMMPAFARDVLQVGPTGLGYLVAASGAGALLGGLHLATWKPHRRRGPLVLAAALVFFSALVLFCTSRQPLLSALLLAVVGGAMVSSVATVNSLIQTVVPNWIRGRVLSMHTMAFLGFTPLGSLLVGALAERWGPPTALAVSSGLALVLTGVIAVAAPEVRRLQ